ncbi:2079_t:CDS:10, partial [Acaulospora colombiana]
MPDDVAHQNPPKSHHEDELTGVDSGPTQLFGNTTTEPSDNWKRVEGSLARPRFEQLFPTSQPLTTGMPGGGSTIPPSSIMDRTHAATTDDDAAQSTYSYDSTRDWAIFFKEVDGRRFSNQSATYILPAAERDLIDDVEFIRLDKQHAAHLIGLGGLYPCPDLVERILAPEIGITKEVLDLGADHRGSVYGTPVSSYEGDRCRYGPSPTQRRSNTIQRCRFDLVHMRCTASGLPDFAQATTYAAQCLKPGGLLLIVDLDTQLCAEDKVTIQKIATPNQPDGSWLARYFYEVRSAFDTSGIDTSKLSETLDRALWNHPLLTNCGAGSMFNPVGPWVKSIDPEEKQRLGFAGILMRQNLKVNKKLSFLGTYDTHRIQAAIQAFHTLLRKKEIPQESIDGLTTNATSVPGQDEEASTSNEKNGGNTSSLPRSDWQPHYRTIHVYTTEEESQAARKLRQDTVGELVKPLALLPNPAIQIVVLEISGQRPSRAHVGKSANRKFYEWTHAFSFNQRGITERDESRDEYRGPRFIQELNTQYFASHVPLKKKPGQWPTSPLLIASFDRNGLGYCARLTGSSSGQVFSTQKSTHKGTLLSLGSKPIGNLNTPEIMERVATISTSAKPEAEATRSENWKEKQSDLARPRYVQPFPATRLQGGGIPGGSNTVDSSSIMDRTHDTTTIGDAAQSTYSYDSSRDWTLFFKEVDGRRFSNQSSTYILPAVAPQSSVYISAQRLLLRDKQHAAHLIGMGGLYPCPDLVEKILAPEPGIIKEILDLGCGTGIWALSMARQFPHARVTGVDMAPTPLPEDQLPPNIDFEIDDINLGLEQFT